MEKIAEFVKTAGYPYSIRQPKALQSGRLPGGYIRTKGDSYNPAEPGDVAWGEGVTYPNKKKPIGKPDPNMGKMGDPKWQHPYQQSLDVKALEEARGKELKARTKEDEALLARTGVKTWNEKKNTWETWDRPEQPTTLPSLPGIDVERISKKQYFDPHAKEWRVWGGPEEQTWLQGVAEGKESLSPQMWAGVAQRMSEPDWAPYWPTWGQDFLRASPYHVPDEMSHKQFQNWLGQAGGQFLY